LKGILLHLIQPRIRKRENFGLRHLGFLARINGVALADRPEKGLKIGPCSAEVSSGTQPRQAYMAKFPKTESLEVFN
jgi:hypothetical protein